MKTPIALFLTDTHLTKDNIELVIDIFDQAIQVCKTNKIDQIICGGDVFTSRSSQPLLVLKAFQYIVEHMKNENITMHVIPGNHDKTDPDSEFSYLDLYDNYINVYCSGSSFDILGLRFLMMPYFREEKWISQFNSIKHLIKKNGNNILITHIAFDGVRNNDGSEVESSIKPADFAAFKKVLIGHYHNASSVAENVIYTGSAYQNNFGETIDDKGFMLIYNDSSIKKIKSNFPRYIKKYVDVKDKQALVEAVEELKRNDGGRSRIIFTGRKEDCESVNPVEFSNIGIDVKFEVAETKEAIEISESDSVLNYDKKAVVKDFLSFCKENEIKGDTMKYGLSLIKSIQYVES